MRSVVCQDTIGRVQLESISELWGGIRPRLQNSSTGWILDSFLRLDSRISVPRSYGAEEGFNSHFHSG